MPQYEMDAIRTIYYKVKVEAASIEEAYAIFDDMITDDFEEVSSATKFEEFQEVQPELK